MESIQDNADRGYTIGCLTEFLVVVTIYMRNVACSTHRRGSSSLKITYLSILFSLFLQPVDSAFARSIPAGKAEKSQSLSETRAVFTPRRHQEPTNSQRMHSRRRSGDCQSLESVMARYEKESLPVSGEWQNITLSYYLPTGNCTASSARFEPSAQTVAVDRRFPLGSKLELKDPETERTITVFASDRCPKRSCTDLNRIDGTLATFRKIGGIVKSGVKKNLLVRVVALPV